MIEYVIWGTHPPQHPEETLLLTEFRGKKITDSQQAKTLMDLLSENGFKELRIQTVNLTDNKIF